jgi:hypothetical protein
MRRIVFPSLGVVLLLLAYAGQDLATGAPSAPRASAQAGFPVARIADEAEVLKHIVVADDRLVQRLARSDPKKRRLVKDLERRDTWVKQKAAKLIADAHSARTAQALPPDQELALEADVEVLITEGPAVTKPELSELQLLLSPPRQKAAASRERATASRDQYATTSNLVKAQQDVFATMARSL